MNRLQSSPTCLESHQHQHYVNHESRNISASWFAGASLVAPLVAQLVKRLPAVWETWVQSPGLGRSPGEGNGNPLQYSCLESSVDRGAWWAAVHGVAKNWTQLRNYLSLSLFMVCWGFHLIICLFRALSLFTQRT